MVACGRDWRWIRAKGYKNKWIFSPFASVTVWHFRLFFEQQRGPVWATQLKLRIIRLEKVSRQEHLFWTAVYISLWRLLACLDFLWSVVRMWKTSRAPYSWARNYRLPESRQKIVWRVRTLEPHLGLDISALLSTFFKYGVQPGPAVEPIQIWRCTNFNVDVVLINPLPPLL